MSDIEAAMKIALAVGEGVELAVEAVKTARNALSHAEAKLAEANAKLESFTMRLADQRHAADDALDKKFDGGEQ